MRKRTTAGLNQRSRQPEISRRMSPEVRRQQIVEGAAAYFAEVGFEGSTRELAERLQITQPLLYRYFSSKEDLIKAVYNRVYIGRWRDEWSEELGDRSIDLETRLIRFYKSYTDVIFDQQWIRIFLFAGLKGLDINRWWGVFVEEQILRRICSEIRASHGLPPPSERPITPEEAEAFWIFHGGIFYCGVRTQVYNVPQQLSRERYLEVSVRALLEGLPSVARSALGY